MDCNKDLKMFMSTELNRTQKNLRDMLISKLITFMIFETI